jgi:hypothetical protein
MQVTVAAAAFAGDRAVLKCQILKLRLFQNFSFWNSNLRFTRLFHQTFGLHQPGFGTTSRDTIFF